MSLADALLDLGLLDSAQIATLADENKELLGERCTELVSRGLLTRRQLGEALAHMTGLPDVATIDLDLAPPVFRKLLLERRPQREVQRPPPARTMAQLVEAKEQLYRMPVVPLRQALETLGLLDRATLARVEAQDPEIFRGHQVKLVNQFLLTRDELGRALALVAGTPEVDARHFLVAANAFEVLPHHVARGYQVLPLGTYRESFVVASGMPTDDELRRSLCAATGATVFMVWAETAAILERLDHEESTRMALARQPAVVEWSAPRRPASQPRVDVDDLSGLPVLDLVAQVETEVDAVQDKQQPEAAVGERSGMAMLVRRMVNDARAENASDIHIECTHDATLIRMRIDGELRPYLNLPAKLRPALVSRIKVMSKLDISERRRPQDGKINFAEFGGDKLELRVAVLPTHDGLENVVLRLLAASEPLPLAKLGLQPRDEKAIERLSAFSFGLVLAVGPTGSGKTTTLHSMLMAINTEDRKIWTAEDPIEITQPGLNQVQVNPKIGVTFAAAMRSFLRADPDVIMIGEIRDSETAKIAVEASLTGHLVLSTLHTNSAAESVVRLLELGLDPMNFSDSLRGIVAQRLVRSLCPHCRARKPLDAAGLEALLDEYVGPTRIPRAEAQRRLLEAAGVSEPSALGVGTPVGCPKCGGKGYKGRLGIYEILENSPVLRELIQRHARPVEIFEAALDAGMRSLRHDALEKLVQGRTDLLQARAAYT